MEAYLSLPFLTLRDPPARIRGSRDALGTQVLWSRLGRDVVRNLTTVTTSVRGFTTLILGLYFAGKLVEDGKADVEKLCPLFLKFEQLAAYSRVALRKGAGADGDREVLGVQRSTRRLAEGNGRVTISAEPAHQILADQRSYGLWGLYSVAARASGLMTEAGQELTDEARAFVESAYLQRFPRGGDELLPFLKGDRDFVPQGRDADLARALASMLGPRLTAGERKFYHDHLVTAGRDDRQSRLWELMREATVRGDGAQAVRFGRRQLDQVRKRCAAAKDTELGEALDRIAVTEGAIAPMGRLFAFLLQRDGSALGAVSREVAAAWGKRVPGVDADGFAAVVAGVLARGYTELAGHTHLLKAAGALSAGDYGEAVRALLALNAEVMRPRGGAPWIELKGETLDVRFTELESPLPERSEIADLWENTYFLNSLEAVGMQVHGGV